MRISSAENQTMAMTSTDYRSSDDGCGVKSLRAMANIRIIRDYKPADNEQKSPISPLQFGNEDFSASNNHVGNSDTSSIHASSASDEDSPRSTDNHNIESLPSAHYNLPDVLNDHRTLKAILTHAEKVSDGLHMFDVKISMISSDISNSVFASLHANSNRARISIDTALALAAEFVKIYDAEHDVRRAISAGPDGIDAQNYVQYVELLEDIIASKAGSKLSITSHYLQESIQSLIKSSLPDRLWITRLNRIVSSLQKMSRRFQEESSHDLRLLEVASQHLVRLWGTILTEYGMITPLPVALPNSTEDLERLPPPPPPLSPHLVLALRDIIQNLASKGKEKVCMEYYKDIRSSKANESLQTLCPNYLEFCSTDQGFEAVNWVDLKKYIHLWRQHLEVLTNILLTVEYELCRQVFSSSLPGPVWKQCFAKLALQAGLQSFINFSEAVTRCKHESLEKLFTFLDMVAALDNVKIRLEQLLTADKIMAGKEVSEKLQNVKLLSMKSVSKSFQYFRFQVDMQVPERVPLDGGILQITITMLTTLCQLFKEPYELNLRQAVFLQPNEEGKNEEFELSRIIHHMLTSLERRINDAITHINSKGQTLTSLFLMNNYWYIHVSLRNNEKLCSLLGRECVERYREKANVFAHKYQREAWAALVEYLGTERNEEMMAKFTNKENYERLSDNDTKQLKRGGGGGSWRILRSQSYHGGKSTGSTKKNQVTHSRLHGTLSSESMKDSSTHRIHHEVHFTLELQRVRAFQVAFEGVCQQHKVWKIPDAELRENLGKAVLKLVVPAYETYLKSLLPLARHSKVQMHLKYNLPMMEKMIRSLFQIGS